MQRNSDIAVEVIIELLVYSKFGNIADTWLHS